MYVFDLFKHQLTARFARLLQLRAASNGSHNDYTSASLDNNAIVSQLQEFKRLIIQSQAGEPQMHAGCTAIVALKCGNTLYVANAGDSRGVLCRAGVMQARPLSIAMIVLLVSLGTWDVLFINIKSYGLYVELFMAVPRMSSVYDVILCLSGYACCVPFFDMDHSVAGKAIALSYDHKPMNVSERARIENAGGTVSNAGGVPRVNGNLNLSRAIGDLKYKANSDLPPEAQIISAHPDVRVFELSAADHFFLLACDGIWDVLSNEVCTNWHRVQLMSVDKISYLVIRTYRTACGQDLSHCVFHSMHTWEISRRICHMHCVPAICIGWHSEAPHVVTIR